MISKNKIKYITSLQNKKFRQKYNKFIIEGQKIVFDVLDSKYIIDEIYITEINNLNLSEIDDNIIVNEVSNEEMKKISALKTPSDILATVDITKPNIDFNLKNDIILCLADIQDPGNLGTILRTANWFGINNVVCSNNTVDLYNSKTLQATMGAFVNTNIVYTDLYDFLKKQTLPIYGTFLSGENIYNDELSNNCIVVMGNEGKGIPKNIETLITRKITIPSFGKENLKAESLNVSSSTAIILSEFKRRM